MPTPEALARLAAPEADHARALQFTAYMQWHLHMQLSAAAAHAASRRVALKGDLPIGVDKRSVDTWLHPTLFRMQASAGAPPDAFDANGQNWGFPTYEWESHKAGGYAWWRGRLAHLAAYFSALRIDHVLGFFRIWELPAHASGGILGRFRPAVPLTRSDLEARGLWDVDRLTQPYVRRHLLVAALGARAEEVACRFLIEDGAGRWRFRPEFGTEQAILAAEGLQPRPGSPGWLIEELSATRVALLTLLRNVLLIPDDADPHSLFHPRFDLCTTSSFAELEGWQRDALRGLADDYFHRRQESGWRAHARATLPPLQAASGMLICGEDLGLVPACVPSVLRDLGILSLRIQRMPPASVRGHFDLPGVYPHAAVCSPSCHDVATTRAWWEEDARRRLEYAAAFLSKQLGGDYARAEKAARAGAAAGAAAAAAVAASADDDSGAGDVEGASSDGAAPAQPPPLPAAATVLAAASEEEEIAAAAAAAGPPPPAKATPELMAEILSLHLASPAALAVFPIQDLLALDGEYCAAVSPDEELVNDPTVKRHYWRYRMRDRLESLAANTAWVSRIRDMVAASGRDTGDKHAPAMRAE